MQLEKYFEAKPQDWHIAYFTMEVGISHNLPTYSGGLGVLAGDTLKSFADLQVPVVALTLLNKKGYFYQRIDDEGQQKELEAKWDISHYFELMPNEVQIRLMGRDVKIKAWRHYVRGISGFRLPIYFLDSDVEPNSEYDRALTHYLYGGDRRYRLCQEAILGIGGIRMLKSLGYSNVRKYHMNEGHAALMTVELFNEAREGKREDDFDVSDVKDKCVFTTHTPVAAGHDRFDIGLFREVLGGYVPEFITDNSLENEKEVNMTLLGLNMSKYVNGVAKIHGSVTQKMFPEYSIHSITNGVHSQSWASAQIADVFDRYLPGWEADPYILRNALSIPNEQVWNAHYGAKAALLDYANKEANLGFHVDRFTIGYARRFTEYKRPDLILSDVRWLESVAQKVGDIQIIFAGKAHPSDYAGKALIKKVLQTANEINSKENRVRVAFLPDYDMRLAKMMVAGCDVWLNTPKQPREASGTSGMKAALNGVPHFSTLDGWWLEGCVEGVTGWSIGEKPNPSDFEDQKSDEEDAHDIYQKLEQDIVPLFYSEREKWIGIMKHCIAINASFFNTYRMVQQYIINAYMK